MPLFLPHLFRGLILLLLAAHVFYMFSIARALAGTIGWSWSTFIIAAGFALIMLLPLIWAVALPEFPEMYLRHVRGRRRFARGECPGCGYRIATEDAPCSECGSAVEPPEPYRICGRTVRTFVLINLFAWVVGLAAAEGWAQYDEHVFLAEAQAAHAAEGSQRFTRARAWPSDSARLQWDVERGVRVEDGQINWTRPPAPGSGRDESPLPKSR